MNSAITIPTTPMAMVMMGRAFWMVSLRSLGLMVRPMSYITWVVPKIRKESKEDMIAAMRPAITMPRTTGGE